MGGVQVDVYNFQGVWDLDGDNNSPQRARMGQTIVDAVKGKQRVILAGDTNARPTTQAIKNIENHLTNVFKAELTTTFNVAQKDLDKFPGYASSVVDMLFVSPAVTVKDHYCPPVNVSDHLPLVATLGIR